MESASETDALAPISVTAESPENREPGPDGSGESDPNLTPAPVTAVAAVAAGGIKGISLKYKLLGLLVTLPLVSLAIYLVLATSLFESDKIAYVFDSTAMAVRSVAARGRVEIENEVRTLSSLIQDYDEGLKRFSPAGRTQLDTTAYFQAVQIYRLGSKPEFQASLRKSGALVDSAVSEGIEKAMKLSDLHLSAILDAQKSGGISIKKPLLESPDLIFIVKLFRSRKAGKADVGPTHAILGYLRMEGLARAILNMKTLSAFLVDPSGHVIFGPDSTNARTVSVQDFSEWKFFSELRGKKVPEGTVESSLPGSKDKTALLASYSMVGLGDLTAIGLVKKEEALKAVKILLWKSIIFFVALISFAVMTSVIASGQLTSTLRQLSNATQKVAGGDFDISVSVKSNDEIGSLAESFNKMAAEVKRLVSETADKARMEKELETAKSVQETLFPDSYFKTREMELAGVYQPASECGGDWWYHCMIGGRLFMWVGDATGHGVPAALLTSAARSAAAIIEKLPDVTPGMAMTFLNNAIHQSSKGKMMMTFFIASINPKNGELIYSNASHDPPFLLRNTSGKLSKKDLEPLNEVNNPRLGELAHHDYSETKLTISPQDAVFFYTDGVPDVKNKAGVAWGQKNFIKSITSNVSEGADVQKAVDQIREQVMTYRDNSELPDDVTFIYCKYQKES